MKISKKIICIILLAVLILSISSIIYSYYNVNIDSRILVITNSHKDSKYVDELRDKLNGTYANVYERDNCIHYVIDVNATLEEIVNSKIHIREDESVEFYYEWQLGHKSSLLDWM